MSPSTAADDEQKLAGRILPWSKIVGQGQIKLALELSYIAPLIGGVLLSGHRGTGKTTAVRAFAGMMHDRLPVTLPINATEDRVIGGWSINELMKGDPVWQEGLLKEANDGMLYVDEVNLLDDHIVNLILDVTATGVLEIQREGHKKREPVRVSLVGTMNPEEGGIRPQLLDRFGLMVNVEAETDSNLRGTILRTVLDHDQAVMALEHGEQSDFLRLGRELDQESRKQLQQARKRVGNVELSEAMAGECVELARMFHAEGHRGDYVLAMAARALAARDDQPKVSKDQLRQVASLALQHRRPEVLQGGRAAWNDDDQDKVMDYLDNA